MRWWRAYSSARHNPKLLRLPDKYFRWWFNFLCSAAENDGYLPSEDDLAIEFRTSVKVINAAIDEIFACGLLDTEEGSDRFRPHDWDVLQYKADVSTERVKRFRQRQRNVAPETVETPSESETEQIQNRAEQSRVDTGANAPADAENTHNDKPIKLPSDWKPSEACRDYATSKGLNPDATAEAFTDYFGGGRGRNEKRPRVGWEKRWRVWCNTDADRKPRAHGSVRPTSSGGDSGAFARAITRLGGS